MNNVEYTMFMLGRPEEIKDTSFSVFCGSYLDDDFYAMIIRNELFIDGCLNENPDIIRISLTKPEYLNGILSKKEKEWFINIMENNWEYVAKFTNSNCADNGIDKIFDNNFDIPDYSLLKTLD